MPVDRITDMGDNRKSSYAITTADMKTTLHSCKFDNAETVVFKIFFKFAGRFYFLRNLKQIVTPYLKADICRKSILNFQFSEDCL